MLHYFARRFFSKILVSPYLEGETLVVYYIDDDVRQESQSTAMKFVNELEKPGTLTRSNNERADLNLHDNTHSLPEMMTNSEVNVQDKPADGTQQLTLNIQCFHWKSLEPVQSWNKTFSKVCKLCRPIYIRHNIGNYMHDKSSCSFVFSSSIENDWICSAHKTMRLTYYVAFVGVLFIHLFCLSALPNIIGISCLILFKP